MYYENNRENYTEEGPMPSPLTKSQFGIEEMEIGPSKSLALVQLAKLCTKKLLVCGSNFLFHSRIVILHNHGL